MKIAQVVSLDASVPPKSQNGLEFVVSWITEELVRRGHEVTLFGTDDSSTKGTLISLLPQKIWEEHRFQWNQPVASYWNGAYAASKSEEFDIIHSHTFSLASHAPFIKTPIVETLHHPFKHSFWLPFFKEKQYAKQMKFVLDSYSEINYVAVSKKQEDQFSEANYFRKHTCIYNGVPIGQFEFNPTPKDYLLYIGYINANKGADVAVKIAKKLDMKLILAGNNFGEEVFFDTHIKPYLSNKIKYVGPVDFKTKVELYKNAVAKIAPIQWDEPFGLTIIEAQACGTPVVAFNKGAAFEIINDGITGFVVEDEVGMGEAVKKIHTIDRKQCRAWVEDNFSVERMVDQYEAYYKKILTERKK